MIKTIYKRFKKKIMWFFIGGVVLAAGTTTILKNDINSGVRGIDDLIFLEQSNFKAVNGKYKRYLKHQRGDISVTVDNYASATKGNGYQITLEREKGGVGYQKSIGYGTREISGTYDWKEVYNNNPFITSTTTP